MLHADAEQGDERLASGADGPAQATATAALRVGSGQGCQEPQRHLWSATYRESEGGGGDLGWMPATTAAAAGSPRASPAPSTHASAPVLLLKPAMSHQCSRPHTSTRRQGDATAARAAATAAGVRSRPVVAFVGGAGLAAAPGGDGGCASGPMAGAWHNNYCHHLSTEAMHVARLSHTPA